MRNELIKISADDYHADPCEVPALSSSIAHTLVSKSPLHAWAQHPKLGGVPRVASKEMDRGSLIHALLLENGKDVAVIDAADYRTNKAKEARDVARERGMVPVLAADYGSAKEAVRILRNRLETLGIDLAGEKEVTALWTEFADDGTEVQCRGMIDILRHWKSGSGSGADILDPKTCRSAHPDACQKHMNGYGYSIQRTAYVRAIEKVIPETAGRVDFAFLFCEEVPPTWAVTPVRMSGAFRELGERQWRRAVNLWAECLQTNQWPAYVGGAIEIEPPAWAMARDMDQELAQGNGDW